MKKPLTRRYLDQAIERAFGRGDAFVRARALMANAIVGQMLPDGAVKGGSSIMLRLGRETSRATTDLDVARASDLENWLANLADSLDKGWEELYQKQIIGLPVLSDVTSAATWVNKLIQQIESSN